MTLIRLHLHHLHTITAVLAVFVFAAVSTQAATHTILFGGQVGFAYAPSQLDVAVGDTVIWEGPFIDHPLSSVSIPQDADTFHVDSGTTYAYPVLVAGTYDYKCDHHLGMVGSFTATVTGVQNAGTGIQPASFQLAQNYPNPFNSRTVIKFSLPETQQVKLKVYSLTGAEIATLINGSMPAGEFIVPFEAGNLSSGVYFYQLITEKYLDTKRLVLVK